jgi:hypothetical protein
MTPGTYPLALYRGDTYHWEFVLWSDAEKTIPYDLTNVDVKSEIRDKSGGATVIALTCTTELPNTIKLDLDATASAGLPPFGVWDLQLTDQTTSDVSTVVAGSVKVTGDVTDSAVG